LSPPDRNLALATTVRTLRGHWIEMRCCRIMSIPLLLIRGPDTDTGRSRTSSSGCAVGSSGRFRDRWSWWRAA